MKLKGYVTIKRDLHKNHKLLKLYEFFNENKKKL